VNYSFFRYGEAYNTDASKSLASLKAGNQSVAIKTLGSITAAGYANSQWEGAGCFDAKMYRNTLDFTIDADNTTIEIGVTGTFDLMRSWCIVGQFELIDLDTEATMDAPFDVTGYITNPGFEYRDMTGWTLSEDGAFGVQNNNQSFKTAWYYGEKWQPSTDGALTARSMSQTLTSLPAGYYKLTANLGGNGTYIDLNGKTASWTEDKDYTIGYVLAENEDLTITAGKTAEGTANWIHFDNFKLYFCGDVAAALTTLLNKLSDYNGAIPSDAYSTLETNVASYNKSYSDVDELLDAIAAVQELYDAADALVDPYTAWLAAKATADSYNVEGINSVVTTQSATVEAATDAATITTATSTVAALNTAYASFSAMKDKADILVAVDNDNDDANSTLSSAISTQNTAATTATSADDINAATSTLKTAMTTYVAAANPVGDGAQFDCTFMMTNPDLTGLATWEAADGWASEETDGNSQVMVNASKTQGDKSYFYEYWSNPAKASGNFALYNAVTLPAGTFSMSCYAFAEDQYTASTVDGVYFYANDTQGSCVTATVLTQQTLSFVNSAEQEVKIGLKTLTGNTRNWMGIGYVELYKVPAVTITIDEDVAYTPESVAGEVTLKRTLSTTTWNTFVVPFQITNEELMAAFGDDVAVATFTEEADGENSTINFNTMTTPAITANTPVLLKPATVDVDNSYVFADRTVATGDVKVAGTNFDFVGTYAASTTIAKGDYFISSDKLYKSVGETTIKGTRAYLKAKSADAKIRLVIDGEDATAIEAIEITGSDVENGNVYDMSGRLVKNPVRGLYIKNGKKVLVK